VTKIRCYSFVVKSVFPFKGSDRISTVFRRPGLNSFRGSPPLHTTHIHLSFRRESFWPLRVTIATVASSSAATRLFGKRKHGPFETVAKDTSVNAAARRYRRDTSANSFPKKSWPRVYLVRPSLSSSSPRVRTHTYHVHRRIYIYIDSRTASRRAGTDTESCRRVCASLSTRATPRSYLSVYPVIPLARVCSVRRPSAFFPRVLILSSLSIYIRRGSTTCCCQSRTRPRDESGQPNRTENARRYARITVPDGRPVSPRASRNGYDRTTRLFTRTVRSSGRTGSGCAPHVRVIISRKRPFSLARDNRGEKENIRSSSITFGVFCFSGVYTRTRAYTHILPNRPEISRFLISRAISCNYTPYTRAIIT